MFYEENWGGGGLMERDLRKVMSNYLILKKAPLFLSLHILNETYVQHFSTRDDIFGHFLKFLLLCE